MTDTFSTERAHMVEHHLRRRGIRDERVLRAMSETRRELFVPEDQRSNAYEDNPLPIGMGQTISQPYIVAEMTQLLDPGPEETVLEIGSGSGYQAAVLSRLAKRVISIERIPELADQARENLAAADITNVEVIDSDGTMGWADEAPYPRIMVTAAGPAIPESLKRQLADGGRLVMPVGSASLQTLLVIDRQGDRFRKTEYGGCRFVKLYGEEGWKENWH